MLDQPSTLIDIRGVCRSFPKGSGEQLLVLEQVDLTIRAGEIVGLLGRSGSGKSMLLRIIAGLVTPSSGSATCRGETIVGPPNGVTEMPPDPFGVIRSPLSELPAAAELVPAPITGHVAPPVMAASAPALSTYCTWRSLPMAVMMTP